MTDGDVSLRRCFHAVFPDLADAEVATASAQTLAQWDSLHALMLIAVVEEEFAVRIPASHYPALRSYAAVREHLASLGAL